MLVVLLLPATALGERRVALVMAVNDYRDIRPLENAVNDALAVEDTLRELGFEVFLETNRDLRRMRRALEDFEEDADGADVALVFFAGHGVEIAGENMLLPLDADASSLEALRQSSLSLEEVRDTIARVGRVGLIVLDACRDNPLGGAGVGGRGAAALQERVVEMVTPGLGRMGRSENVLYAFSAAPGETASDGTDGNSPFTSALTRYLGADGLEIRSVLTLVQQEVYDRTSGAQLPYVESGLPRLFFASATPRDLPERERLLLAMADLTPDLRAEVEAVAAQAGMPLAPLFGALIGLGEDARGAEARSSALREAAQAFVAVRAEMRALASTDPEVERLRGEAEAALALGEFDKARAVLTEAAEIDSISREALGERLVDRTLSEAATHTLNGGAARARLDHATAAQDYDRAADLYRGIEALGLPAAARARRAETLELLGATRIALGELGVAQDVFQEMLRSAEQELELDPHSADVRHRVAVSRVKLGGVAEMAGDLEQARTAYLGAEAIWEELLADMPDDAGWLRELSVVQSRLGGVERWSGNLAGAAQAYRKSLELAEALVLAFPDDDAMRRDLMAGYSQIGGIYQAQGQFDDAMQAHEFALQAAMRLTDGGTSDDFGLLRELSIAHVKMGEVHLALGELPQALDSYQAAREVARSLVERDTQNASLLRDYSVTLDGVANTLRASGDEDGALTAFEESLVIARRLAALDPANLGWQRDLQVGYGNLGTAYLAAGRTEIATEMFEAAHEIAERLVEADPGNGVWQRDLAIGLNRLAGAHLSAGDTESALDRYREALTINRDLALRSPEDVDLQVALVISHFSLGMADSDRAENLERALAILRELEAGGRLPARNAPWIGIVEGELSALAAR